MKKTIIPGLLDSTALPPSLAATQSIFQTSPSLGMAFVYRSRGFGVSFRLVHELVVLAYIESKKDENGGCLLLLEGVMTFTHAVSVIVFGGLILFGHGCAAPQGHISGTDHAVVHGHVATVGVSPTFKVEVPVNVALGDKVAEVAANAAVGYLKGLPGTITPSNRADAAQQGVAAGVKKAAETGQQVDQKVLETFVQEAVAKTGL